MTSQADIIEQMIKKFRRNKISVPTPTPAAHPVPVKAPTPVTPIENFFLTSGSPTAVNIGKAMHKQRTAAPAKAPTPTPKKPVMEVTSIEYSFLTSGSPTAVKIGEAMYNQRKTAETKETPPAAKAPEPPGLPPGMMLVRRSDIKALQKAAKKQPTIEYVPYPYIPRLPRRYGVSRATGQVGRRIGRGAEFEHMLASKKFAVRRLGGLF